jgi:hypothetical protein
MQDFPQQDQTNCESEVCEIQNNALSDHPGKEKHKRATGLGITLQRIKNGNYYVKTKNRSDNFSPNS